MFGFRSSSRLPRFLPALPDNLEALELFIKQKEQKEGPVRPDNEARIVWNTPDHPEVTSYALVYIHGFSASQGESHPLHREIAQHFGMNVYLSRLAAHGTSGEAFEHLTAQDFLQSALFAYAVGKKIGKKIILMGTSTGASLSLYLASLFPEIAGLILYSPLIDFFHPILRIVGHRFAKNVQRVFFKHYMIQTRSGHIDEVAKYWYSNYHINGVFALKELISSTMHKTTFHNILQPTFIGTYFKNKKEQDRRVQVQKIRTMHQELSTPFSSKIIRDYPDAQAHVITNPTLSSCWEEVRDDTIHFIDQKIIS